MPKKLPAASPFVPLAQLKQLEQANRQLAGLLQGRNNLVVAFLRRLALKDGVAAPASAEWVLTDAEFQANAGWNIHIAPNEAAQTVTVSLTPPVPKEEGTPPAGKPDILIAQPGDLKRLRKPGLTQ